LNTAFKKFDNQAILAFKNFSTTKGKVHKIKELFFSWRFLAVGPLFA
jgi:hypothetical protein